MKEYFYAFLLGIASTIVSFLLVEGLWLVCNSPNGYDSAAVTLFWTLSLSLGTLFFYKIYCPRKGIALDTNQKVWAGMWYAIGIAVIYFACAYIMFLLFHPHCGLRS
jgi:hypothetical protein